MSPSLIIQATQANAFTTQGMLDAWKNAFGIEAPLPDTAALITAPTPFPGTTLLASYELADVTIDSSTEVSASGAFTVSLAGQTGIVTATWQLTLTPAKNTAYVGFVLFNKASGDAFAFSAVSISASSILTPVTWIASVPLSTSVFCQG